MSRLRILHIITRLDRGGSAENTLLTATGLDPERFDVTVAVGPTAGDPGPTLLRARERGVTFVDVPSLIRAPHPWQDLRAALDLRRLVRDGSWDVVHTHTSKAGILGRWAAQRGGVRAIVHTPHGHVFYGYYGRLVTSAFVRLERLAAGWCHRLVALTPADRDDHLRFGVGAPSQWVVVHSGVDFSALEQPGPTHAQVRASLGLGERDVIVATLGRLTAVKGQEDLVRAVARLREQHPRIVLLLIGDGEEEEALRELAAREGVADRTLFVGWRTDVGDLLRAVDLFALPSHNEGMGKALVEAMYLERPVVASRVGGVPELVEDGVEGLLVPPRSPADLADALDRLLRDPQRARELGARAARRAREYSSERMVQRLADLYEELCGTPAAVRREEAAHA